MGGGGWWGGGGGAVLTICCFYHFYYFSLFSCFGRYSNDLPRPQYSQKKSKKLVHII